MTSADLQSMKLFARNLTARADRVVLGNPVTTRPEDAVENCFPGLEFDQRNFDKAFFPGVLFEWHHDGGVAVRLRDPQGAAGFFTDDDLKSGVFLIAFAGRFSARRPGPPRFLTRFVLPPAGLDAWRLARDVEPGPLSIILGSRALFDLAQQSEDVRGQLDSWVSFNAETGAPPEATTNEQGQFKWIVGVGERARFLTSEGVIDPAHISPGRSLEKHVRAVAI
ncbi:MAG: hypothetical protein ACT4O2_14270 [Beijerinckiaceae bacterium]